MQVILSCSEIAQLSDFQPHIERNAPQRHALTEKLSSKLDISAQS